MNNIFFDEKESWLLWLIVGFFAASMIFLIASNTQDSSYLISATVAVFLLLTSYMAYTKRFTFTRAMKISVLIFSFTLAPMLFFSFEQIKLFGNADIIIRFFVLSIFVVSSSFICSMIVRKPKEYF